MQSASFIPKVECHCHLFAGQGRLCYILLVSYSQCENIWCENIRAARIAARTVYTKFCPLCNLLACLSLRLSSVSSVLATGLRVYSRGQQVATKDLFRVHVSWLTALLVFSSLMGQANRRYVRVATGGDTRLVRVRYLKRRPAQGKEISTAVICEILLELKAQACTILETSLASRVLFTNACFRGLLFLYITKSY